MSEKVAVADSAPSIGAHVVMWRNFTKRPPSESGQETEINQMGNCKLYGKTKVPFDFKVQSLTEPRRPLEHSAKTGGYFHAG